MAVYFPRPYSTKVISVATGMEHASEESASAHGFIKNNSVTLSGFSVGTFSKNTLRYTYWTAIGY